MKKKTKKLSSIAANEDGTPSTKVIPVSAQDLTLEERKYFESLFNNAEGTTIDAENIRLIYEAALKIGKKITTSNDEIDLVFEGLEKIIQMMYSTPTKENYDALKMKIDSVNPAYNNHLWASVGIQSALQTYLSQQYQMLAALRACEQAKVELLAEIKKNMSSDEQKNFFSPRLDGTRLLQEFTTDPSKFEDKPYKNALEAYKALDEMSNTLKSTQKPVKNILKDFNESLDKHSSLLEKNLEKNRGSTLGNIIRKLLLSLTGLDMFATKGKKLIKELKEVTKPEEQGKSPKLK